MVIARDLMTVSRIEGSLRHAKASLRRVDEPDHLPPAGEVDLLLVDWGDRYPDWGPAIAAWRDRGEDGPGPRIILFGPHSDLDAHAAARDAGLGPMRARSAVFAALPDLVEELGSA